MNSKDLLNQQRENTLVQMQEAFKNDSPKEAASLFMQYDQQVHDGLRKEFNELVQNGDNAILQSRGRRVLTQKETKYYEQVIAAMKSPDYKQALNNIEMPETIIEDVFKDLVEAHPLLSFINFTDVKALTTWILNDHTIDTAKWGELDEEITKEISSAFKKIQLNQYKLSAFFILDNAMLDLGPVYLDMYVRTILADSLSTGLEKAAVTGDGKNSPIGMDRNIAKDVTITGGVYPRKEKIVVKSFVPKEYGPLLAKMAKNENGRSRKFDRVLLICNQTDYLTKVMPATTVLNNVGSYVNNLFPFPTDVVVSNELADGEAIVALPKEYFFGLGMSSKIEHSDHVKFLEDKRAYRAKLHGNGKMTDNTCSLLLDISGLDQAYVTVKSVVDATGQQAVMKAGAKG